VEAHPVWAGHRIFCYVTVDTDEGIDGVGEVGITARELGASGITEHFKQLLVGLDPFRIEHINQLLYRGGFYPARHLVSAVISAIDMALWDIKGKALSVPVYELLGGLVREKVVCYPHNAGEGMALEPLIESCLQTKAEGWKFVRLGLPTDRVTLEPAESIRVAVQQVQAVREAVGDDIEICFDVHTRLDLPDALRFCQEVEPFCPYFIEDPLRSEDFALYRMLRLRTRVPLAAGEQAGTKWELRPLIEEDLIDYARIDPCNIGGITEAKKVAGWCEAHHIKFALHNPLGPVSNAACLHLNLAIPNCGVQEQPRKPGTTLTDVFPVQVEWADGYLLPPTRPGLGVVFDREAAKQRPFQFYERPYLRRRDGSFTNY
jgi:galactonate dehydratase